MGERIAARLVTGPAAFLLGGLLDVAAYLRAARRARRARVAGGDGPASGRQIG